MARGASKPGAHRGKTVKSTASTPGQKTGKHDAGQAPAGSVPLELQQRCLDIFSATFKPGSDDDVTLQEVKGHLYNRDFYAAFSKDEYLRVYASRWSPSRALAYLQVFDDIATYLPLVSGNVRDSEQDGSLRVVCIGGGAGGELVALAGWVGMQQDGNPLSAPTRLHVDLVDIADWMSITNALEKGIKIPPELSKYASQAKKNSNTALLLPEMLSTTFQQQDVLDTAKDNVEYMSRPVGGADLVTFMFTLNELYSTSTSKTQGLLGKIKAVMRPGALLLVVDSPGSYSTVAMNGVERKYPMQWLLDYTLLGPLQERRAANASGKWEKLISDDSRWFRLPEGLQYPIGLENMRYQVHLYRRLGGDST